MSDQPARPFSHLDAPNAELYRGVMGAFVAAKRRFLVHLRPEDVVESLREAGGDEGGPPLDGAAMEAALKQLEQWGNLRADLDTSRVTTVDDFYRTRYLYQLSAEGEAAELALAAYDEALGNRGELQSVALEDIRVRLRSLRQQAELPDPDPAVVHSLLRELSTLLDGLAANATAFMSSLQRTIDLQEVDEDAFIAYKDRLIGYLERFIGDLVVKSAEIVTTLRDLESQPGTPASRALSVQVGEAQRRYATGSPDGPGVEGLLALAAAREAADAAPDQRDADEALRAKLDGWRARWSGLRSWLVPRRPRAPVAGGAAAPARPRGHPGAARRCDHAAGAPHRPQRPLGRFPRSCPLVRGGTERRRGAPPVASGVRAGIRTAPQHRRRHPRGPRGAAGAGGDGLGRGPAGHDQPTPSRHRPPSAPRHPREDRRPQPGTAAPGGVAGG